MKRVFSLLVLFALVSAITVSCAPPAATTPTPTGKSAATPAPASTPASATTAAPAATAAPKTTTPPAKTERKPEGTLTVVEGDLGTERWLIHLGPMSTLSAVEGLYEGLLYTMPGAKDPVPGLAERWEVNKDHTVWTYYLRKGVQFHDGWGEFTADDVKFSYDLMVSTDSVHTSAYRWRDMVRSVRVVNPYQIAFDTKPVYDLNELVRNRPFSFFVMSKKYIESAGIDKAAANPIGTGPYRFAEHKRGEYLKLEALDSHWRVVPYYKTVIIKKVPDQSTQVAMLRNGEADLVQVDPSVTKDLKSAGFKTIAVPFDNSLDLLFTGNYQAGSKGYDPSLPYGYGQGDKGLKLRKAIALGINKKEIIDNIYFGMADPYPVRYFNTEHPEYDQAWKPYPYDPDQAKKLLSEAGYPNGLDLKILSYTQPGSPLGPRTVEAIAMQLQKVGIRLEIVPVDYSVFLQKLRGRSFDSLSMIAMAGSGDALAFVTGAKSTAAAASFEINDALIDKALAAVDPQDRVKAVRDLGQFEYDNYVTVPLLWMNGIYGVSKKVGNWPLPSGAAYPIYFEYVTP